jgi:DNA-binding response OmpR family regulator
MLQRKISEDTMQIGVEVSRAVENKRIFVVEDDEVIRSALQFILHDENETHELATLEQAYVKGRDWKPDLILLGVSIVQAKGIGALAEIAAQTPGAKILIVADSADDPVALACLKSGAHGLLAKPITIEAVRFRVDVLLGRRKLPMVPLNVLN